MKLQTRLYIISAVVLLVGLGSSLWIYLTSNDPEIVMGYEIVGGKAYLVNPENSKKFVHDMEQIGGKSFVLASEFSRWFTGLWHGKSLAFTVAFIAVFISAGFFFFARTSPSGIQDDAHDEK